MEDKVGEVEANSNSVVSSLEQILLAVDNIYSKCDKHKKNWTEHTFETKDFDKYDNPKKPARRVAEAKQKIKNIYNYIEDYDAIIKSFENKGNK